MGRNNWIRVAVIGIVALLILLAATSMMSPWTDRLGGMMGPGMMGSWGILGGMWMLLVPIIVLAVLVLGLLWLARQMLPPQASGGSASEAVPCPHCGRFVQVGWLACPYCGRALVSGGPPDGAAS